MTLVALMTESFLIAEHQQVVSLVRLWLKMLQYISFYYRFALLKTDYNTNDTQKVEKKRRFIFPPHPTNGSTLPSKTGN